VAVVSPVGLWDYSAMTDIAVTNHAVVTPDAALITALGSRSVVLVGMMGSGKSSIGRRLAARLAIAFVDADTEIEDAAGMTIPEIFELHGEPYFRAGETRVIARLLDQGPQVLATGGGAFMSQDTRAAVRAKGVSVWLKADLDVLMKRIKRRGDRPLLKTDDPAATLTALIAERYPVYAEADLTVLSRDVPHEAIVEEIVAALRPRLVGGEGGS
jgi:shikimate kinase